MVEFWVRGRLVAPTVVLGAVVLAANALPGCVGEPRPPKSDLATVASVLATADADPTAQSELAERGAATFDQMNCATCHRFDATPMTGPRLDGLYDRQLKLNTGQTGVRDRAYLWRSIARPHEEFVHGYGGASRMTNFGQVLDNDEVAGLIAYLETYSTKGPPTADDQADSDRGQIDGDVDAGQVKGVNEDL